MILWQDLLLITLLKIQSTTNKKNNIFVDLCTQDGIDIFDANNFHIDEIDPDSLILRSQLLTDADFNQSRFFNLP